MNNRSPFEDELIHLKNVPNYGILWSFLSFCFFTLSRALFQRNVPQRVALQGPYFQWRWPNICNSLLHSIISGFGSSYALYESPKLSDNIIWSYSTLAHVLCCVSVGYFASDLYDILTHPRQKSSYEMILHHIFAGSCFVISATTRYYIGFGMYALTVELNSIFLHWRQLLLLAQTQKRGNYFRIVSLLNLTTFIGFRMIALAYMSWLVLLYGQYVPQPDISVAYIADIGVVIMSSVLLYRLIKADYNIFWSEEKPSKEEVPKEKLISEFQNNNSIKNHSN